MAVSKSEIEELIIKAFPSSSYEIKDLVGDGDHYSLIIEDSSFKGKTIISQHKMVKEALRSILKEKLHAITIKTKIK